MRAVLLLNDSYVVEQWQYDALSEACQAGLEVALVATCTNAPERNISRKNIAYYALAWLVRRTTTTTAPVSLSALLPSDVPRLRFAAVYEGAWQRIPDTASAHFHGIDIVIKFGMTLLRGADELPVTHGVLSYHHGAPEVFRGRPASFYELLQGVHTQGVIVQQLSDKLDGGRILARATSRVSPHSYRQTLQSSRQAGVPLLAKAVSTLAAGISGVEPDELGPNYRLPATKDVLRLTTKLTLRKISRAWYGFAMEKKWRVGITKSHIDSNSDNILYFTNISPLDPPPGFTFAADPFWSGRGEVACELMDARSGLGVIGRWRKGEWETDYFQPLGHVSYPQVVSDGENQYLFPEIASFSAPRLFPLKPDGRPLTNGRVLSGLEDERIIDGTLHSDGKNWYLFGGRRSSASNRLDLWVAKDVSGPYHLHPASPICLDICGARMAGPIALIEGLPYRLGQDCSKNYGGKLRIHQIDRLTPSDYHETITGSVSMSGGWGPHTLTATAEGLLIDYYTEHTTPLAGYRRAVALVSRIRSKPAAE